jgi:hypothetical protein
MLPEKIKIPARLRAKHMREGSPGGVYSQHAFTASVVGLPPHYLDKLDLDDYTELADAVWAVHGKNFEERSPAGGR